MDQRLRAAALLAAFFLAQIGLTVTAPASAGEYALASPNERLKVSVSVDDLVRYEVSLDGKSTIAPSAIGLSINGDRGVGKNPEVASADRRSHDGVYTPVLPRKNKTVVEQYEELTIRFSGGVNLVFRAYNHGVAYRWDTALPGEITIEAEQFALVFPEDAEAWFTGGENFKSSHERVFQPTPISQVDPGQVGYTGVLFDLSDGRKLFVSESNLRDYPGLWLRRDAENPLAMTGAFPAFPKTIEVVRDREIEVTERQPYLAKTDGTRELPWRLMIVAENDAQLIESELVELLSAPCELEDTSWIKPGRVAWDWWNDWNLTGVDFRAGINTETYKHYIDFAAENGLEWIILDEGWSDTTDILSIQPDVDLPELIRYGNEKGVGLVLWVVWRTLDEQLEEALDAMAEWGVVGIKVDFMDHDDQQMVNYFWRVAREAAERELLVNFHGSYKPAGLHRTYPNVITREGVRGLEYTKWSDTVTPEHNLTIPFVRMVAGPLDYTPGAMRNAFGENFRSTNSRPVSQGTRCHQLAMYVVYESPMQMLCDTPSNYRKEPLSLDFIASVPTVWDETRVLAASVSDYLVVARRRGDRWFLGAMTDGTARELQLDLGFLPEGEHKLRAWVDGINADRHAEDHRVDESTVTNATELTIKMAPGGGFAGIIE
ncbi:MAG: glycoside hydrolase family 97 protein [Planctomycetota bacterium]